MHHCDHITEMYGHVYTQFVIGYVFEISLIYGVEGEPHIKADRERN